jgi:hypothetical protein
MSETTETAAARRKAEAAAAARAAELVAAQRDERQIDLPLHEETPRG